VGAFFEQGGKGLRGRSISFEEGAARPGGRGLTRRNLAGLIRITVGSQNKLSAGPGAALLEIETKKKPPRTAQLGTRRDARRKASPPPTAKPLGKAEKSGTKY